MTATIAQIENAILARLKAFADADVLGYDWGSLDSYPDDWDVFLKEKTQWKAPAAWVSFLGWGASERLTTGNLRVQASFGMVVAAENARNETATRHGGTDAGGEQIAAEPGSYQLLQDAVAILAESDVGLDIQTFTIAQVRGIRPPAALKDRNLSMFAVQLETAFEIALITEDAGVADFESFHVNWDVPPFGNVDGDPDEEGVQIPADATADATDHVELPQ